MAKKVVVDDQTTEENRPIKKKRSKCCACCVALLVFILVILAAAFGVGWYFGDKFTKQQLGMSLGDTLGILGDLYWTDDGDVVKNPYKQSDLDGFYKEIKRNVLLKESAEIDFDGALSDAIDKYLQSGEAQPQSALRARYSSDTEYSDVDIDGGDGSVGDGDQATDGNPMTDIFVDMIAGVLTRDNIDVELLNAYDENDPSTDKYIFELNDKQFAAFVDNVIGTLLAKADSVQSLKQYADMIDLVKVVSLKQIRFFATPVTTESGEKISATSADVTLWVGLQSAAGQALTYYLNDAGYGWAGPLARWLGNVILPENLYVTLTVPLDGNAKPAITLNDMNDAERARAYKLVNAVMAMNGDESQTVDGMLDGLVENIKPFLESAAENMKFDKVATGTISIDLLDAVTKMASESSEGAPLVKADFIFMLQALFSDPASQYAALEPYRYENVYDVNGKEVYIAGGDPDKTAIDYEQRFIDEIAEKYSVEFKDGTTLDDVLALLGVSLGGGDVDKADLLDLINADKFNESLEKDLSELELTVTDRMLAAALSGQMDKLLTGDGGGFGGLSLALDALTFVKNSGSDNLYALLAVEADVSDLFDSIDGGSLVAKLATGLMPEKILLTVKVDITRDRPAGATPDETTFVLNSCLNTDRALDALAKLVPSLDLGEMAGQIESMLNDMLDQLYKALDIRLVASAMEYDQTNGWSGNGGAIVMPDIFTVVTDTALVDEEGDRIVTPDELKNVLRALNDTSGVDTRVNVEKNYSGFIAQVVDKYYLAPAAGDKLETLDDLTAFMGGFDTSKFRITGDDPSVKYLAHDTRSVAELRPVMSGGEIGALFVEQAGENVKDYAVTNVTTGDDSLTVVLAISMGDLLPDDVKFLMTAETLYVTATVDMSVTNGSGTESDPYRYGVSVALNAMDAATYDATLKIVRFFDPEFDIQAQVDEFGKILYDQMRSVNDSFAASVDGGVAAVKTDFFEFTESGLVMNDFYTFLASKMELELTDGVTTDTLKRAVQGMYERSTVAALANENNYTRGDVMVNAGSAAGTSTMPSMNVTYADTEFNAFLAKGVEGMGSVNVEQTIVLSETDNSAEAAAVRAWASSKLSADKALAANTDYLIVSVSMVMGDFMESDNEKSQGFLPSSVIGTLVYEYTNGNFEQVGIIFNDLGDPEYRVLQQLMGLSADSTDENKVNIATVDGRTAELLNNIVKVMNVELRPQYNGIGIGSIYTSQK